MKAFVPISINSFLKFFLNLTCNHWVAWVSQGEDRGYVIGNDKHDRLVYWLAKAGGIRTNRHTHTHTHTHTHISIHPRIHTCRCQTMLSKSARIQGFQLCSPYIPISKIRVLPAFPIGNDSNIKKKEAQEGITDKQVIDCLILTVRNQLSFFFV